MSLVKNKSISSALAMALIGASALTAFAIIAPDLPVRADTTVTYAPATGFAELAKKVMPSVVSVQVKFATTAAQGDGQPPVIPGMPPDGPFNDFFKNMPKDQKPQGGKGEEQPPTGAPQLAGGSVFGSVQRRFLVHFSSLVVLAEANR